MYGQIEPVENDVDQPVLSVVIDTEEEFDWAKPHSRESTGTAALKNIDHVQDIFDFFGVVPCYVVDYPVATHSEHNEKLRGIHADGRCVIGAHLHPWVNPPHSEPVNRHNSFPGNLDKALELEKLTVLTDEIEKAFGERPKCYKAGRYGIGINSIESLESLGYRVELSPTPGFDYSCEEGPDFSHYSNRPFRYGNGSLCLPCTGGFIGRFGEKSPKIYEWATAGIISPFRVPGILARLGLLERIRLSPEGYTLEELIRLTEFLLNQGVKFFTLSFHSPSVEDGRTPYVQNREELKGFLNTIHDYLTSFKSDIGGRFSDPLRILNELNMTELSNDY